MKIKLSIVILFIFLSLSYRSYSKTFEYVSSDNEIKFHFNTYKTEFIHSEGDGNKYIVKIKNSNESSPATELQYLVDEIQLKIAVPADGNLILNYRFASKKYLGKVDIAQNNAVIATVNINKISNLSPSVKLERVGIIRGLPIAELIVQPFEYDVITKELYIIDSVDIEITLPTTEHITQFTCSARDYPYFSSIVNKEHINSILQSRVENIKNQNVMLSDSNSWYSPDKNYVKITTTHDGIAIAKASEILKYNPGLLGINKKYLHMYYRGNEYPIAFVNDTNEKFDISDEIIFSGKRPIGDTTWFNIFTNYEVFYLFADTTKEGLRLKPFPFNVIPVNTITDVNINSHIEFDKVYCDGLGDLITNTETVMGEGWFWDFISSIPDYSINDNPFQKKNFNYPVMLTPAENSSESLKVSFNLVTKSSNDSTYLPNYQNLGTFLNSDSMSSYHLTKRSTGTASYTALCDKFLSGFNNIGLTEEGLLNSNNNLVQPDDVWIDYVTVEGKASPFAYKSTADFYINNVTDDSKVAVPGFSNPNIAVIDTLNQFLDFPIDDVKSGTTIRLSTKKNTNPINSIVVNDSSYIQNGKGLFITVFHAPGFINYERMFFQTFGDNLKNYLNSIEDGSVIALTYNSDIDIPSQIKNIFSVFGSQMINSVSSQNTWCFAVIKNNAGSAVEKTGTNILSLSRFIEHQGGKSFACTQNLKAGYNFTLSFSDSSAFEQAGVSGVTSSDLLNTLQQIDVIIISEKSLLAQADSLAAYHRRTTHLNVNVVDVDNIYKEFNFGIKSPHAIKNYLKYAYFSYQKPAPGYLILFGNACWDMRGVLPTTKYKDMVPTYGFPVSDYWYTLLDGDDYYPEIAVGRLPVSNITEANNYLSKLYEYDNATTNPWMKNFFFMTGGYGTDQITSLSWYSNDFGTYDILPPPLCGETTSVIKVDDITAGESQSNTIKSIINNGAIWVNYLGHSSPSVFDMDGWQVDRLNNKGKYGFLTTLSCNSGCYAEPAFSPRNKDYFLAIDKGFIAAGGSSATGEITSDVKLLSSMYACIKDSGFRRLGDIFVYSKSQLFPAGFEGLAMMQFALLGDPLTELKIGIKPDLYFVPQNVSIKNDLNESDISEVDSIITVSGTIYNAGICEYDSVAVLFTRKYDNKTDSIWVNFPGICNNAPFTVQFPVKNMPGVHELNIIIDPDSTVIDENRKNNTYKVTLNVYSEKLLPLEPLSFWDMRPTGPIFRVINPLSGKDNFQYLFEIRKSSDTSSVIIYASDSSEIINDESFIEWRPNLRLDTNTSYWFTARSVRLSNMQVSSILQVPFFSKSVRDPILTNWVQSGSEQLSDNQVQDLYIGTTGIHIINKFVKDSIISICGNSQVGRYASINIDGKNYAEYGVNIDRGLSVILVSALNGTVVGKKTYDTWGELYGEDSAAVHFNRFLRDSVSDSDYVIIVTADQAFREFGMYPPGNAGSFDSLKSVLHMYGSRLVDSIKQFFTSFVMIGRRGAIIGSIPEAVDTTGGALIIVGDLPIPSPSGTFTTPVLGPAKAWNNVKLDGYLPDSLTNINISVIGYPKDGTAEQLLIQSQNSASISLSKISAGDFPNIKLKVDLVRLNDLINPYVSTIDAQFIPAPEYTIIKSQTKILNDSVMRADSSLMQIVVRNISRRINSDSTWLDEKFYPNNEQDTTLIVPALKADEVYIFSQKIDTRNLALLNKINLNLNPSEYQNEIYAFNNSAQLNLHIYEDTTKPTIELKIDGVPIDSILNNGGYVSISPNIDVLMKDNSLLPVNDNSLYVFINGEYFGYNTPSCTFKSYGEQRPDKATLFFKKDSLSFRDNNIMVIAIDGSGNKDTLLATVYVSNKGSILNIKNNPNPFETGTTFSFNYKSPDLISVANIDIYDLRGIRIASLTRNVTLGKNELFWNGQDLDGNLVPPGMYFYRLSIQGTVWTDPVYGKCVVNR